MKWVRKSLILVHRYLGIVLGLLFFVWFLSGIGMMYAGGMPQLTAQMRLLRLPPIDLSRIVLTPAEAAARLEPADENGSAPGAPRDRSRGPGGVVVGALLERPVYRFGGGRGGGGIVYADDGAVLNGVDAAMARAIAAHFMSVPEEKLRQSLITEADQWTIGQRRQMPLHKIEVQDGDGSVLYLSPESGEVLVLTTRATRALAWVAAIPHWLYFTPLRVNDRLWNRVIIWTSVIGCFLALLGIILGIIQFRYSRPLRISRIGSHIPYSGLMRWHYITGVIFGIFTLTWVFSGLLSMDPWEWVSGRDLRVNREQFTGGAVDLTSYPKFDAPAWSQLVGGKPIKEIEYTRIEGDPYYVVRVPGAERLLVAVNPLEVRRDLFNVDSLVTRLKKAVPDAQIVESQLLTDYDSYYYSRNEPRPLPVLRAKFDDPKETWVYIDPAMGQVAGQLHRGDRIQRWLYNGLHSLDFSFWYGSARRGVWEAGMIVLNLGGAAVSGIGFWIGIKRMGRWLKRVKRIESV
jgi:uncharacterized iron-regulated membrane protein